MMVIAALAAGNVLTGNLALHAADTNTAPATPLPGAPAAGQRPSGMRGPSLEQLAQQLSLTDDQKTKVKPILDAQLQQMRDLRADTSLSSQDRRTKMQGIREETAAQMKVVLNPEQFDKWQKMSPMGQRQLRPIGPHPGDEKPGGTNAPVAPPKN